MAGSAAGPWTTVANWRGYGSVEYQGLVYGQKAHSLRRLLSLPAESGARCLLALSIHPDEKRDLSRLADNQWELVDPAMVAGTPRDYRTFIQGSAAEIGVAKTGYVLSRCGWFSDRSVCYLATGRPVVMQQTGFESDVPTGEGLLSFETTQDAAQAIEAVRSGYRRHSRAAHSIAREYFDSGKILSALLDRLSGSTG